MTNPFNDSVLFSTRHTFLYRCFCPSFQPTEEHLEFHWYLTHSREFRAFPQLFYLILKRLSIWIMMKIRFYKLLLWQQKIWLTGKHTPTCFSAESKAESSSGRLVYAKPAAAVLLTWFKDKTYVPEVTNEF